jgi:hypothetical protein
LHVLVNRHVSRIRSEINVAFSHKTAILPISRARVPERRRLLVIAQKVGKN